MKKLIHGVFAALALLLVTSTVVSAATVTFNWMPDTPVGITGTLTLSDAAIPASGGWGPINPTVDFFEFNLIDYTASVTAASGFGSGDGSTLDNGNVTFAPSSAAMTINLGLDIVNITTTGQGGGSTQYKGDWVAAVPVPAAVWLFGSGLLALAGFARKKAA